MKPIRQLLRRPGKTMLGVILTALACVLLCVSVGQYYAACQMETRVQETYTTIALPTKYNSARVDKDGNILADGEEEDKDAAGKIFFSSQPPEIRSFLAGLAENYPEIVESVEQLGLVSGYCASICPVNYRSKADEGNGEGLAYLSNEPYNCAILAISIDEISDVRPFATAEEMLWGVNPADSGAVVDVKGTVLEAYSLAPEYDDPTGRTIQIELRIEDAEAFDALGLKIGKEYLVYSSRYTDLDWELRQWISGGEQAVFDSISWDNVEPLSDEEREVVNKDIELYGIESEYVSVYHAFVNGEEISYLLNEDLLSWINSCRMTVCSNPAVAMGCLTQEEVLDCNSGGLETMPQKEYVQQYRQAGICPIDAIDSDGVWETAQASTEINHHAFPVITTGNLQSVAQFASQDARMTAGRYFTQEEYESGSSVCVLSESLAVSNGLGVGDSITIQYYQTDANLPGQIDFKTANPIPAYYSPVKGFSSEAVSYEIVGLYRQNNEWSGYDYAFTPNTIFVPQNSVTCQTETSDSGFFRTFVLKNGTSEAMDAELEKAGYPGLLSYYDQGFSQIKGNLNDYFSVAKTILLIGTIGWLIFVTAFLILFPLHQKKEAQRMWTLGTSEKQITSYITGSGIGILLPGSVLAGCVSLALLQYALNYIEDYTGIFAEFSLPFLFVILIAGAQAILASGLIYLTARIIAKTPQKESGDPR